MGLKGRDNVIQHLKGGEAVGGRKGAKVGERCRAWEREREQVQQHQQERDND